MTITLDFCAKRIFVAGWAATTLTFAAPAQAATFTTFTDRSAFETALVGVAAIATPVVEDFNGDSVNFGANTTGGVVGQRTAVDIIGHIGDDSEQGLTGTGFFEGEVDGGGSDEVDILFNTGPILGFGLDGLQDNNDTPEFDPEEIGILFGGELFLVSDILGLSDSSDGTPVDDTETGAVFIGILSDTAFSSFTLLHGDKVAPGGVDGANENFWIDELVLAPAVPLPAGLPLLLAGLGAFGVMRRRR
ncbi:MAG: VPLPA-CTERM sorting domain-containing protein [Roseobacter sp.]